MMRFLRQHILYSRLMMRFLRQHIRYFGIGITRIFR